MICIQEKYIKITNTCDYAQKYENLDFFFFTGFKPKSKFGQPEYSDGKFCAERIIKIAIFVFPIVTQT